MQQLTRTCPASKPRPSRIAMASAALCVTAILSACGGGDPTPTPDPGLITDSVRTAAAQQTVAGNALCSQAAHGILARMKSTSEQEGYASAQCGRLIRKAWVTGRAKLN